jgi:ferritin
VLDKKLADLLNNQFNKELWSAYIYLDAANFYAGKGLNGYANWFYVQMQEERDHAMMFRNYLLESEAEIALTAIDPPTCKYSDFMDPLKATVAHEQVVTKLINKIYELALELKDYRTQSFLHWFVKEQGEEEKNAAELVQSFELFGTDAKGLYALNQEYAARLYTPIAQAAD